MVARVGHRPDHLLLLGGFGSSLYLRHCLDTAFLGTMGSIKSPPFAYSAAVEGAVRFLQGPDTSGTRGFQVIVPKALRPQRR
jgi:hypothetical protein